MSHILCIPHPYHIPVISIIACVHKIQDKLLITEKEQEKITNPSHQLRVFWWKEYCWCNDSVVGRKSSESPSLFPSEVLGDASVALISSQDFRMIELLTTFRSSGFGILRGDKIYHQHFVFLLQTYSDDERICLGKKTRVSLFTYMQCKVV